MNAKLKPLAEGRWQRAIPVNTPRFVVGRSDQCHLRVASPWASRIHCELLLNDEGMVVHDLNSRHGTYVNGQRVDSECPLRDGDVIAVGTSLFAVQLHSDFRGLLRKAWTHIQEHGATR